MLLCAALSAQANDFSFDLGSYRKKPYEWKGHLEMTGEQAWLDRDAALYNLNLRDPGQPQSLQRLTVLAQLEGLYRFDDASLHARAQVQKREDNLSSSAQALMQEFYYAVRPSDSLTLELGKRALKWGKGYAWNPVGFVERAKDPNDPDLSREGYVMATGDWVRSFDGNLKTVAFTPVLLPVGNEWNGDFSAREDLNFAARLYLLYRDTDIDLYAMPQGSRSARYGFDFSLNLSSNIEVHGEFAYLDDQPQAVLDASGRLSRRTRDSVRALLGVRYLTESDITWIAEYYHNGAGYDDEQLSHFLALAQVNPVTDPATFSAAIAARNAGFGAPNPGRDYLYLRASSKDPFDLVYVTAALSNIVNLQDGSFSVIPEVIYTGFKDTELRARLAWLHGDAQSEFGEKQNDSRLEVRFRYFF